MTRKNDIITAATELLESKQEGMRYTDLLKAIQDRYPDFPRGTIHDTIRTLEKQKPDIFYKPARGLFRLVRYREADGSQTTVTEADTIDTGTVRIREKDFYEPFADWLVNELEECTKAIALGGSTFGGKWGTPDVVGIREPKKSDIIKFSTEIVSAEIKLDSRSLIAAFGQACSYKLFSHKVYIVVPATSKPEDIARLDALGRLFGIGLILFDENNVKLPNFDIRVRAVKHEPDMFYANDNLKEIEEELFA